MTFNINRRRFVQTASASLALSALGAQGLEIAYQKPKRVGLIGSGWYGKNDIFRLIQVAPVDVVAVCDVDKKMMEDAGFTQVVYHELTFGISTVHVGVKP